MKSNYKRIGDYIREINNINTNLSVNYLRGISSIYKEFISSKANIVGVDFLDYKIVKNGQFAFNPNTARMGDKIPIALNNGKDCIVSKIYPVFEIFDKDKLDSEYLMMWFRRPEFDRYARFKSHGSAREIFDWEEMCNTEIPVPHINKQREIVKEYNVLVDRIKLNNLLIQKLEETAQSIYKQWFVDLEFPNEKGKPYKSSGGEMEFNKEMKKDIPKGWRYENLGNVVKIIRGASPRPIEDFMSTDNSGMPWVKIADATACATKYLFETKEYLSNEGVLKSRKVNPDTLILSNSASPGLPKIMMIDACVHDGWLIFDDYKSITKEFLYNFLLLNRREIVSSSNGSVFNNLKTDILKQYKIIIPDKVTLNHATQIYQSLDEQFRVAAKIDHCLSEVLKMLFAKMSKTVN